MSLINISWHTIVEFTLESRRVRLNIFSAKTGGRRDLAEFSDDMGFSQQRIPSLFSLQKNRFNVENQRNKET